GNSLPTAHTRRWADVGVLKQVQEAQAHAPRHTLAVEGQGYAHWADDGMRLSRRLDAAGGVCRSFGDVRCGRSFGLRRYLANRTPLLAAVGLDSGLFHRV